MYIGRNIDSINNISTLDNLSFNGSDTVFNLTQNSVAFNIVSVDALQIQIDGIIQVGNFTQTGGSQITFDFTPNANSVCNSVKHFGVGLLTTVSDSSITTAKLGADAVTTAKINDGAVTSGKIASGVIPSTRPNVNPIIINGDMQVAQRSTSVSTTAGGYKTVDRLQFNTSSTTGNATFTQENDAPSNTAFRKSMKITPNATETVDAGKNILFTYALEGQDVQVLQHGSASPPKATLSFWVKSSKTGAYCVQVKEESISNESYVLFEYTISQANTWEQKVFSWTGNSAHTLNNDNAMGMRLCFHLASGSDDHRSATTSWVDDSTYRTTANQVNFFDSTSNTWYITGIQLEVGEYTSSTLPPFQHESYADNLDRCHRYYISYGNVGTTQSGFPARAYSGSGLMWAVTLPKPLRASPTVTLTGTIRAFGSSNTHDSTSAFGVTSYANTNSTIVMLQSTGFSGLSNDRSYNVMAINDTFYTLNAEL